MGGREPNAAAVKRVTSIGVLVFVLAGLAACGGGASPQASRAGAHAPLITQFPLSAAQAGPDGIAVGPDGALWFPAFDANAIGRITTSGAVSSFTLPTADAGPDFIAAGPDGALWFTELDTNRVGRITTAGTITEYVLPHDDSQPVAITAGPDGALWFTEQRTQSIGRITTAGAITEYPGR